MSDEAMNVDAHKNWEIGKRGTPLTPDLLADMKKYFAKPIIKSSDMPSELISEAIDLCVSAIDKHLGNYEASAKKVKEEMDRKFGTTWHCIIGKAYGFDCTFQEKSHLYAFYQGQIGILLFKC